MEEEEDCSFPTSYPNALLLYLLNLPDNFVSKLYMRNNFEN